MMISQAYARVVSERIVRVECKFLTFRKYGRAVFKIADADFELGSAVWLDSAV